MSTYAPGFNPTNLKLLRMKIETTLKDLDPEVTVKVGSATYDPDNFTIKVICTRVGGETRSQQALKIFADMYKVDTAKVANIPQIGSCMLVEFKDRSPKFPWVVAMVDMAGKPTGKRYKLTEDGAQKYFALAPATPK